MTKEEKEIIKKDLKNMCSFLDSLIANVLMTQVEDKEVQKVVDYYREGTKQIRHHIGKEYEAMELDKV